MKIDGKIIAGIVIGGLVLGTWWFLFSGSGIFGGPWIEFGVAGWVLVLLLGAVRWSASRQSAEHELGPGALHEPAIVAQFDPALAATDGAVREYIDTGSPTLLGERVEGVLRDRLQPLMDAPPQRPIQIIAPAWSYLGMTIAIAVVIGTLAQAMSGLDGIPQDALLASAVGLAGLALYGMVFNNYGGFWWVRSVWALGGLGVFLWGLSIYPGAFRFVFVGNASTSLSVMGVLVLLTGIPYLQRHRVPKFVTQTADMGPLHELRMAQTGRAVRILMVGGGLLALVLVLITLPVIPSSTVEALQFGAGILPGILIGVAAPSLVRAAASWINGALALKRVQKRRTERAQHIISIFEDFA